MRAEDNLVPRRPRRPQLNDEAAAFVREMIMSGQLQPGEFLRPDSVAETLGISATPVREGLLALRSEGFLLLEPRRGFVVAPLSAADIRDLFRAQSLLAGELAARAASRLQASDEEELDRLQEALADAAKEEDTDEMEVLNHNFHRVINRAADSRKLAWSLSVVARYVPSRFYAGIDGWPEASLVDHARIIKALHRRNAEASRSAMEAHVDHAGSLLAAHFDQLASTAEPTH